MSPKAIRNRNAVEASILLFEIIELLKIRKRGMHQIERWCLLVPNHHLGFTFAMVTRTGYEIRRDPVEVSCRRRRRSRRVVRGA
ncbi:MAG: hypothetical protein GY721_00080 [Deltaproteobacteria bacterium]|nr:hypothetical protein [Deltaproteobacteria bacterium]